MISVHIFLLFNLVLVIEEKCYLSFLIFDDRIFFFSLFFIFFTRIIEVFSIDF